jgi:hypothetical protein
LSCGEVVVGGNQNITLDHSAVSRYKSLHTCELPSEPNSSPKVLSVK